MEDPNRNLPAQQNDPQSNLPAYPQSAQRTYVQPPQQTYSQPAQQTYAQPGQPTYTQPTQQTYAQPAQSAYPQPTQQTYSQPPQQTYPQAAPVSAGPTKFCSHCGQRIDTQAVICPYCGCQVELLQTAQAQQPQVVINNTNTNTNTNPNTNTNVNPNRNTNTNDFRDFNRSAAPMQAAGGRMRNKWVALALCFFLGGFGAHKFYEGKVGMGILYLCTVGLFGIGWFIDLIRLLLKPNPYFV